MPRTHQMVLERMIADRVTPLTRNKGRLVLSSARIYFQPFNNIDPEPVVKFSCVLRC